MIENEQAVKKALEDAPRKTRKLVKSKPPKGYVAWDEAIFDGWSPYAEPLVPHLRVTHALLLNLLDRPGDGCSALASLLTDNDEPRSIQRKLIRQSISIYRSLIAAGALERLDAPDERGRTIRVTSDLQSDFALDNPLSHDPRSGATP